MNLLYEFNLASGLILFVVGLLTLYKRGWNSYSRPFLFFLAINIAGIAAVTFEISTVSWLWSTGYFLLYFYLSFLPFAVHWLGSQWGLDASEYSRRNIVLSRLFFILSCVLFIFIWAVRGVDLNLVEGRWLLDLKDWRFWISAYLIVGVSSGAYSIETCYRSSLGLAREKIKRSFFPLLAYLIGLLGLATIGILYGRINDLMITVVFVLLALVSLPVARHYILFYPAQDGIILTRRGMYSSLVVVLFGVYFLVIGAIGELLVKYNLDEGLFFSVVILIMMVVTFMILVVSQTIRSRLKIVSSPKSPFRDKGMYAAEWKEFTEEVSVLLSMDAIYARTSRLLHRLLKIDNCFFVIKETAPSDNYSLYSGDGIDRGIPGEQLELLSDWLYRFGHAAETTLISEKAPQEAKQMKRLDKAAGFPVFMLVPFIARQKMLGFWGIGYHSSGRRLSSDEIGFIEAASSPVSLTIFGAGLTDELLSSREMESFHKFSSFVLHDLKNSVAMLSMLLQNAEKNINNPEFQKEALVTINKAVNRQKKIISRLTEQEQDDKLSLKATDLSKLVAMTVERIRLETVKSVTSEVSIEDGLTVIVDPDKIGSVFDNLIMNAVEAMPEGGHLEIKSITGRKKGMIGISFKDNGVGMTQEFIATRLFKPFSSTKAHGLGVGMYQTREIINANRGLIEINSRPGEGTEIIVYLPSEA